MEERYEEMARMREHVMKELDKNGDKLVSLEEFMEYTKSEDFNKDEGWDVSFIEYLLVITVQVTDQSLLENFSQMLFCGGFLFNQSFVGSKLVNVDILMNVLVNHS